MTALAARRNHCVYIALIVIGAGFVLIYRGIGWMFVRGYAGDWLIVQLIYVLARLTIPYRWRYPLALAVLLFAYGVEVVQFVAAGSIPQNVATELTIGSTFDVGDLAAYTLGAVTALLTERFWKS